MKYRNYDMSDNVDWIFKFALVIMIIILLIHNCALLKEKDKYQNNKQPNGNMDIIEITCDKGQCQPIPTSKPTSTTKPSSNGGGSKTTSKKITSLSFAQDNVSVKKGNQLKLIVVVEPADLASSKFTWKSSNPLVATVDSKGVVRGLKEGTTIITVTSSNGISTTCVVTVTTDTVHVDSVSLNNNNVTLNVGDVNQLVATIEPANATEGELTWTSSDSSVVSVDSKGVIKGLKPGTATITVKTKDGKTTTCTVTVETIAVESITLSSNEMSVKVGASSQITAVVKPNNATYQELTWTSSDSSIVSVDSKGVIKGLKPGTATITVKTKDGKETTCTVTVEAVDVESITLNPSEMSVKVGTSSQITAIVKPDDATYPEVTWTSSDSSVVKVDKNGKVTGVKKGTATITAKSKDGKVQTTCVVTVTTDDIDVEDIELSTDNVTVKVGSSEQVVATVKPDNATDRELVWSSSDSSIAKVDSTGKVTGVKSGTATITVKTKDGKVQKTITVTVESVFIEDELNVYDEEKDPVEWNGSNDLKIFSRSIYNVDGIIAPESENTYQFVVRNETGYKIKYNINFIETNNYNINMKYKLKKNDSYIINNYSNASDLAVSEYTLNPGEYDTYFLDWKWISSSNDTAIGANPEARYGLKIEVKAESINE